MTIGERLKIARKNQGLTQQEVADVLHVSRTTISSWEVGRTYPSLELIVDLSNLYDLSLDILLKEDMEMVKQVSQEIRKKGLYKKIVIVIASCLGLFLILNSIWLIRSYSQYQYLKKNWELVEDSYVYSEQNIDYFTTTYDLGRQVSQNYLKKNTIWLMGNMKATDNRDDILYSMIINEEGQVSTVIPVFGEGPSFSVVIDENINYDVSSNDQDWFTTGKGEALNEKDIKAAKAYLEANEKPLKKLYKSTKKQYDLINGFEKVKVD